MHRRLIRGLGIVVALAALVTQSALAAGHGTPAARPAAAAALTATAGPAHAQTGTAKPATAKPAAAKPAATPAADAGPQLTFDTAKGTIVVQLFAKDAPKSVAHIVALAKRGYYNQQRFFRVVKGQLVQFGDIQTRDATLRDWWGRGPQSNSGSPIGVAEIVKTRKHRIGTVGLAHAGDPTSSDNQLYFALSPRPNLDGKHAIVGQVVSGLDVLPKLAAGDVIKKVTVTDAPGT